MTELVETIKEPLEGVEVLNYKNLFEDIKTGLSPKELELLAPPIKLLKEQDVPSIEGELARMGFVKFEGGLIQMGGKDGLPCSIEGSRLNETPKRAMNVPPFWISKYTVTNQQYEQFDKKHSRTNTSKGDKNPVTCLTYGRAISYILWLNQQTGLSFRLPTEPEYIASIAPYGWQYPYKQDGYPRRRSQNHYRAFTELYPDGELGSTLEVDDLSVPPSYLGVCHPTGNVSIFSLGHFSTEGHWGSNSDGAYTIVLGGNFRLCPFGTRTLTRGIVDVTAIGDTIGIRLLHPDPEYLLREMSVIKS